MSFLSLTSSLSPYLFSFYSLSIPLLSPSFLRVLFFTFPSPSPYIPLHVLCLYFLYLFCSLLFLVSFSLLLFLKPNIFLSSHTFAFPSLYLFYFSSYDLAFSSSILPFFSSQTINNNLFFHSLPRPFSSPHLFLPSFPTYLFLFSYSQNKFPSFSSLPPSPTVLLLSSSSCHVFPSINQYQPSSSRSNLLLSLCVVSSTPSLSHFPSIINIIIYLPSSFPFFPLS